MKHLILFIIGLCIGSLLLSNVYLNRANAQTAYTETKLIASDGTATDSFGFSTGADGNILVVGARHDDPTATDSGSVYVYRWNGTTWVEEQKLVANDGAEYAYLGYAVAVAGNVIVAGASWDDDIGYGSGSVYVFRWDGTTWVEEQKLTASDGADLDQFGNAVSIANDTIIVGAFQSDSNGTNSGAAYVFRWDGVSWIEEQKLSASDGTNGDAFGSSVSISDDAILIGSYGDDDNGNSSGSAYIYRWTGTSWAEDQKLIASDGASQDQYGYAVSINGDIALIGAYLDDDGGEDSGTTYIYRWNGTIWEEEQKLIASDADVGDQFGYSVSLSDARIVVGAYANDAHGDNAGAAYLFHWDGVSWIEETKLTASDAQAGDLFGNAVTAVGEFIIASAKFDDDNGTNSGSVYIYSVVPPATSTPTATPPPATPTPSPTPGNLFVPSQQYMSNRPSRSVTLGDLDNDGDTDAVVSNSDSNRVWLNLGDGIFIDTGQSLYDLGTDVALGDLDADGDLDVVLIRAGAGSGSVHVWRNNGDGTFVSGQSFGTGHPLTAIALGNVNGDAHLDVVATGNLNSSVWLNNGFGHFTQDMNQFGGATPQGTDVSLGDIDGDNDDDLIIAFVGGSSHAWQNDNGNFAVPIQQFSDNQEIVKLADLNNDGHLDAFFVDRGEVWLNDGTAVFAKVQTINSLIPHNLALGDIDNDGDVDAIASTDHGNFVWLNDGNGIFANTEEKLATDGAIGIGQTAVADLDGDSDLDIFAVHYSGSSSSSSPNIVWFNQTTSLHVPCGTGSYFVEENGRVVIEAEHYSSMAPGSGNASAHFWGWWPEATPEQSALQVLPDNGTSTNLEANGPGLQYAVHFTTPGAYHVFIRGRASTAFPGGSDSVHVGLNGMPTTMNSGIGLTGFGLYGTWQNDSNSGQPTVVNVSTPGWHILNIWMREDGFILDKIWLDIAQAIENGDTSDGPPESLCRTSP